MMVKDVKKIRGGEILAESLYMKDATLLIPKGAVLKKEYAELLISLNVEFVQVEDGYQPYEKPMLLINVDKKKEYVERIKQILERHIYSGKGALKKIEGLAEDMIAEISVKDNYVIYDFAQENPNLYEHTTMVTMLSLMTARKLGLTEDKLYNIAIGCLLHDLGLRYITISYVNQSFNTASAADIFEYKKHTILAYTVLEEEGWLPVVSKKMILSHHEKMDGSGFPLKQKKQEIECKIIQLCDTFDCMISGMECKPCSVWFTVEYLLSQSGKRYDKEVVDTFLSFIAKYPVGTEVELNNGRFGIVSLQLKKPDKPIIVLLDQMNGEVRYDEFCDLEKESSILIQKVIQ